MGTYKFRDGTTVSVDSLEIRSGASLDLDLDDISCTTVSTTGDVTIDGGSDLILDDSAIGGSLVLRQYDSGVVALATDGAATALTLGIPAQAGLVSYAFAVTTTIADIDSTTGTIALTGGNTSSLGTISAFTDTERISAVAPGSVNLTTSATTNASFTLSGGADNVPSAGAVRMIVWAWVQEDLD